MTNAPPAPPEVDTSRARWQRVSGPVALGAIVLVATVLLHFRDPHQSGSWGFCPWLVLTGTQCPGCGGLRAVNDLTRGDVAAAASSNLLFVGAIPVMVFFWGRTLVRRWAGVTHEINPRASLWWTGAFVTLAVVFWVVRNLPFATWLAP